MAYLKKRGGKWYVVMEIPRRYQKLLGRIQITKTTGTGDKAEALRRKPAIEVELQRRMNEYIREAERITESGEILKKMTGFGFPPKFWSPEELEDAAKATEIEWDILRRTYINIGAVPETITLDEFIQKYRRHFSGIGALAVRPGREQRPLGLSYPEVQTLHLPSPPEIRSLKGDNMALEDLAESYISHRAQRPKTQDDIRRAVAAFQELVPEVAHPAEITKEHVRKFRDRLLSVPRSRKRGESLTTAINRKGPSDATLSAKTVNDKYLTFLDSLFRWAVAEDKLESNPFAGIRVPLPVRRKRRMPFTGEDLQKLFANMGSLRRDHQMLLVLLSVTGARIEELAALNVSDVQKRGDITYLRIFEEDDKTTKNEASNRKIPIHPAAVPLLREFIGSRSSGKLFTSFKPNNQYKRYSDAPSKSLNRFIKEVLKVDEPNVKVVHSFRNTFYEIATDAGMSDREIQAIVGHSDGRTQTRTYREKIPLHILHEEISKIEVDWLPEEI